MQTLFNALYGYMFVIELSICYSIFVFRLPRRSHFWIRLAVYFAVMLAASAVWKSEWANSINIFLVMLRYVLLFALSLCGVKFLFKASILTTLYCGAAAYALQNCAFRVGSLVADVIYYYSGSNSYLIDSASKFFMDAVVYGAFGYFFARKNYIDEKVCRSNKVIIIVNLATVLTVACLSVVLDRYKTNPNFIVQVVCSLYAIACSGFICFYLNSIARNDSLLAENQTLESMLHQKGEQLAVSKETIEIINVKCHDMKHRLGLLRNKMSDEEVEELEKTMEIYDVSLHTDNEVLDLLLAEKGLLCRNEKIRFNCIVDGKLLSFMSDTDLYSMFGNAMDNAIAAVSCLHEDKRIINLSVREAAGMVSVHMDNWFSGKLTFNGDLPVTTKEDKAYHGYGLKSVKRTVEKYGGFMSITTEGEIFKLNITFPKHSL